MSALLTQSPGDTVQTGTGKVDPARKIKCTTAARAQFPGTKLYSYNAISDNDIYEILEHRTGQKGIVENPTCTSIEGESLKISFTISLVDKCLKKLNFF